MQIFRRICQQCLPLICDPLIHDGVQTRLQRRAHSPSAQAEREQVAAVNGEIPERKAGIRRKQRLICSRYDDVGNSLFYDREPEV